jgi:hypothetical protein
MKRNIIFIFSLIIITLFCFSAEAAENTEPIGVVIEVYGEVRAKNGASSMPLALKDALAVSDTIITGSSGRIKILLRDDTIITLGADAELELTAFADAGRSPKFNASLLKGAMRVITGRITEINPGGFTVTTPHSTVGIRGTIFSLRTDKRRTNLYVLNTDKDVIFNGTNIAENYKAIAETGQPLQIAPLSRQEKESIIRELVMPPASRTDDSGTGSDTSSSRLLDHNESHSQRTLTGTFQGTISSAMSDGTFSFDVDLLSGNINNAVTNGSYDTDFTWDLSGGRGEFCADDKFEITGFDGIAKNDANPEQTLVHSQTWLAGSASSFASGTPIDDGYFQLSLSDPNSSAPPAQIILPIVGAAK